MDVVETTQKNFKSTDYTRLRWFQYKKLYTIILRAVSYFSERLWIPLIAKMLNKLFCTFWEYRKVEDFWLEVHKHFEHCTNTTNTNRKSSKELIILGVRANLVTDRITDSVLPSITPNILARPM